MHVLTIKVPFSSEGRLEKYVRTKVVVLEEQLLIQFKIVAASWRESNVRRK